MVDMAATADPLKRKETITVLSVGMFSIKKMRNK
jgi:hypothetical protein